LPAALEVWFHRPSAAVATGDLRPEARSAACKENTRMRLLTLTFQSAEKFLRHYSDQYEVGAVFYRTKSEVESGEEVLLEIAFPGLPNKALVRGVVLGPKEDGIWIAFHRNDISTRDFLLKIARGELEITNRSPRAHDRFPADVPVSYKALSGPGEMRHARAIDLAAASAFVRTDEPPEMGTRLELVLGPLGDEAETFTVQGEVTKLRNDDDPGFAVHFDAQAADGPRLRRLLRTASETGRVSL
jgi:Tfp pilus assembly protein PilZ